jgi:hypothetical protein
MCVSEVYSVFPSDFLCTAMVTHILSKHETYKLSSYSEVQYVCVCVYTRDIRK